MLSSNFDERSRKRPRSVNSDVSETDSAFAELMDFLDVDRQTSNARDPFHGLHPDVRTFLREERGITKLYDWQEQCLAQHSANPERNLIVSLPTGGGKTLFAEILLLKTVLFENKDALLILPFVSIVQEKMKSLQQLAVHFEFHVEEYAASRGRIPPIKRRRKKSIYVATIEKSQLFMNSLIKEKRIETIGIVIIDELHMLGEGGNRGATLEKVITTLKVAAKKTRIVGLSATLGNMQELKDFLKADVFASEFRPVPLTEYVKLGNKIYEMPRNGVSNFKDLRMERRINSELFDDPDNISSLVAEVVPAASCLVFCSTKKNTERVAQLLAKTLPKPLESHRVKEKLELLDQLKLEIGVDAADMSDLRRCVRMGVAYHHSGLTIDERNLLQEAFLNGILCVICCTSTLAAGVNLPARRVILRSPLIGREFMTRQQYRQMIGRAGRAGLDASGESFIIINGKQLTKSLDLLQRVVENCQSSLLGNDLRDLERYLLNAIDLQLVTRDADLHSFVAETLAYVQRNRLNDDILGCADKALNELRKSGLIESTNDDRGDEKLVTTKLGRAVVDGGFDTRDYLRVHEHLRKSIQCMALSTHLNLLYCVVLPFDGWSKAQVNVDWNVFYNEYCAMGDDERRVLKLLSITEGYLLNKKRGVTTKYEAAERLFSALILWRLWKGQESISAVAERFGVLRGVVQQLSKECAASAGSLLRYVENLDEFWSLKLLLPEIAKRLTYCAKPELIPLMEIRGVKRGRANQLYHAGFKTLGSIADADVRTLVSSIEHLSRRQAEQIITSAKMLRDEKMEILLEEAKIFLANPEDPNADDRTLNFLSRFSQVIN